MENAFLSLKSDQFAWCTNHDLVLDDLFKRLFWAYEAVEEVRKQSELQKQFLNPGNITSTAGAHLLQSRSQSSTHL